MVSHQSLRKRHQTLKKKKNLLRSNYKTSVSVSRRRKRTNHTSKVILPLACIIHGELVNRHAILPFNIELVTFSQTGSSLTYTSAAHLFTILQRNSHKLNTIELDSISNSRYTLSLPNGDTDTLFVRSYTAGSSYPDLDLVFSNLLGELHILGFYLPSVMSLDLHAIQGTGMENTLTQSFLDFIQITYGAVDRVFPLQFLLTWLSSYLETIPGKQNKIPIFRLFLFSCQTINSVIGAPPENMELNLHPIDFGTYLNRI